MVLYHTSQQKLFYKKYLQTVCTCMLEMIGKQDATVFAINIHDSHKVTYLLNLLSVFNCKYSKKLIKPFPESFV